MSILKAELKQLITHEIGVRIEDVHEAAKKDLSMLEGRQNAFSDGAKAVEALLVSVDKDVEEGKFDLVIAEHVKKYIVRCSGCLQSLSVQAQQHRIAQTGKVAAFDHTMKLLTNLIDEEKRKVAAMQATAAEAQAAGLPAEERQVGLMSIKNQRLEEEAPIPLVVEPVVEIPPPEQRYEFKKQRGKKSRASNS